MSRKHLPLVFVLVLFLLYAFSPDYVGVGQTTRFDLTKAIVLDGTFAITPYIENTIDWAFLDGKYYTNKAPGLSFMAVPMYWLLTTIEPLLGIDPATTDFLNFRITDSFVTALPNAGFCLFLLYYLLSLKPYNPRKAWAIVLTYAVGTIAYPFATMSWGHTTAGVFLFLSFYFLATNRSKKRKVPNPIYAGFFFGMSVLTEYSCFLVGPALGVYLILKNKKSPLLVKKLVQFGCGGLPVFILFAYYHQACFGGWLSLPHSYENPEFREQAKLWGVIGVPSLKVLYDILFSFHRGLIIISPVLIFTFYGFYKGIRKTNYKLEVWVALWAVFSFWFFNGSFNGWHGGWSAGPRYLVPILPFLVLPLFWANHGKIFQLLMVFSVINVAAISAVNVLTPPGFNLLFEQIYPNLPGRLFPYFILIMIGVFSLFAIAIKSAQKMEKSPR